MPPNQLQVRGRQNYLAGQSGEESAARAYKDLGYHLWSFLFSPFFIEGIDSSKALEPTSGPLESTTDRVPLIEAVRKACFFLHLGCLVPVID